MSNFNSDNLISVQSGIQEGQRLLKLSDGTFIPVGMANSVSSSSNVDLSFITAGSENILSGYIGANSSGQQVIGTIPTVSAIQSGSVLTVPSGFVQSSQTFQMGVNVSDTTATAQFVVQGVSFYNSSGILTSGTIPWRTYQNVYVSDGMVIVDGGFYDQSLGKSLPEGQVTSIGNTVTITSGYHASSTVTVGSSNSGGNIIPCTSSTTLNAGTYLTSSLTIQGDVNLTSSNIVSGTTIFGITGTAETGGGGSSTKYYKCAEVTQASSGTSSDTLIVTGKSGFNATDYDIIDPTSTGYNMVWYSPTTELYIFHDTYHWVFAPEYPAPMVTFYYRAAEYPWSEGGSWLDNMAEPVPELVVSQTEGSATEASWSGYEVTLSNGVYNFDNTLTTNLSCDEVIPIVGEIYSSDAKIAISDLYRGIFPDNYITFLGSISDNVTGDIGTIAGNSITIDGLVSNGLNRYISFNPSKITIANLSQFSICLDVFISTEGASVDNILFVITNNSSLYSKCNIRCNNLYLLSKWRDSGSGDTGTMKSIISPTAIELNRWYSYCVVFDSPNVTIYINGVQVATSSNFTGMTSNNYSVRFGSSNEEEFYGKLKNFRLFKAALTEQQVNAFSTFK